MMHHIAYSSPLPGAFDVAGKFFREANTPLDTRIRHYFVDSSMCPLLVQVWDLQPHEHVTETAHL